MKPSSTNYFINYSPTILIPTKMYNPLLSDRTCWHKWSGPFRHHPTFGEEMNKQLVGVGSTGWSPMEKGSVGGHVLWCRVCTCGGKLDGAAPLMTDRPPANSPLQKSIYTFHKFQGFVLGRSWLSDWLTFIMQFLGQPWLYRLYQIQVEANCCIQLELL